MNNYRDDSQDTAVASNSTFGGFNSISDGVARVTGAWFFGLSILLSSSAIASDEVIDSSVQSINDSAFIYDETLGHNTTTQVHTDSAKIVERYSHNLLAIQSDSAAIEDNLLTGSTLSTTVDSAAISDSVTSQRTVTHLLTDSAQIKDTISAIERELIENDLVASDSVIDRLQAVQLTVDSAAIEDANISTTANVINDSIGVFDQVIAQRHVKSSVTNAIKINDRLLFSRTDNIVESISISDTSQGRWIARGILTDSVAISNTVLDSIIQNAIIMDSIVINDEVVDKLDAVVLIIDGMVIEDRVVNIGGAQGQAWTANVDSWAMSRYNPYNYSRLVVIDGVLYGEADDGVYQLDQPASAVVASIRTGKMDLGNGQLTHPATAYLEYELSGNAAMSVTTTQKGSEQTYTYALPNELAGELTNGRFIFGRGLRGRHFSFELVMIGTHGHINDLSIEHFPTSRRV